jgi:octaprenyl-diphosphate synthase
MMEPPALGRGEAEPLLVREHASLYQTVAKELAQVDLRLARELRGRHPFVTALVDHVWGYRGKRLRPMLLLLSAKAVGEVCEEHLVLAAVVEMIHTATLVHDDVLDQAVVRRHRATVNAEWGTESSVLLGDYLFTHAFHLAASLGSTLACRLIGRATNLVCEGELHQIHQRGNLQLDEPEYFEIIQGKTAELCAVSCQLGAHYAGASPSLEQAMVRYGHNLGMAFQISDDLLDLLGEEQSTGKSLGTDVDQQKLTLPLIWLLRHGSPVMVREVEQILGSSDVHKRERLRPLLEESDAFRYAQDQAERFAAAARGETGELKESAARNALVQLTYFVTRRSS